MKLTETPLTGHIDAVAVSGTYRNFKAQHFSCHHGHFRSILPLQSYAD